MKKESKLISILATIEYMLDVLSENDRLALVQFNEKASILFDLDYLTKNNKTKVLQIIQNIKTQRNTNISEGLFTAISILNSRIEKNLPISRILLLTDGHSNCGLGDEEVIEILKEEKLDENLTIHCFGYGKNHSSSFLQMIAFKSPGGLYYYIENVNQIAESFGDCISCTFATVAYSIHVHLEAFDGCRFVKIATKFPFQSVKSMKNYVGYLGSMYSNESKSILMRLSLRKMNEGEHKLFKISLSYKNAFDDRKYVISNIVSIQRYSSNCLISPFHFSNKNKELEKQVHRITAIEAIDHAINAAYVKNFGTAQQIIQSTIQKIYNSSTGSDSYCINLLADLEICKKCVSNQDIFESFGKHKVHQYIAVYNQERFFYFREQQPCIEKTFCYCSTEQKFGEDKISHSHFLTFGSVILEQV